MAVYVRFEDNPTGDVSEEYGPYPFVQLTHEVLRVGPEGEDLASLDKADEWRPLVSGVVGDKAYGDVVIYHERPSAREGGE